MIAATNRDLSECVEQGTFREDLYYRLKVFPINMPPLRKRKTDIPVLVNHFIGLQHRESGKRISGIREQAMEVMMAYPWPGNVRELRNAIEFAFIVCPGELIDVADLPTEIKQYQLHPSKFRKKGLFPGHIIPAPERLSPETLFNLLNECDWNKAEVGRRAGLSRTTIWTYMKKWDIPLKRNSFPCDGIYKDNPGVGVSSG